MQVEDFRRELGQSLSVGQQQRSLEVCGVVTDVLLWQLSAPSPRGRVIGEDLDLAGADCPGPVGCTDQAMAELQVRADQPTGGWHPPMLARDDRFDGHHIVGPWTPSF